MSTWQPEQICDADRLFMRVHRVWVLRGEVLPGAFQNRPAGATGMSTDWERYSTPEQTRQRSNRPSEQAVIEMIVGAVRGIPCQTVEHKPVSDNRAHTEVVGVKDEEVRLKLTRMYKWAIPLASS